MKEILDKIENPATSPGELSEILLRLSAEYYRKSDEFARVVVANKVTWSAYRQDPHFKTDRQVDKHIGGTLDGQAETKLHLELKGLEKLMSSIKAHLRIKEVESRNFM